MGSEAPPTTRARARALLLVVAFVVVTAFVVATELAPNRRIAGLLDNIDWTVAFAFAAAIAYSGYADAEGATRTARGWFTAALVAMTLGQGIWFAQVEADWLPFPGPNDAAFLLVGTFVYVGLATQIRHLPAAERGACVLDGLGISLGVLTLTVGLYSPHRGNLSTFASVVLVLYPVLHIGAAGWGFVVLLARRIRFRPRHYLFLGSLLTLGVAWMVWNWWLLEDALEEGVFLNYVFSYASLALGVAAAEWDVTDGATEELDRAYYVVSSSVPLAIVLAAALALVFGQELGFGTYVAVRVSAVLVVVVAVVRQSLLLRDRDRLLRAEHSARETEERFRQLAEQIDDVFVITDVAAHRPVYLGPAFEDIWGRPKEDVLAGKVAWTDTVHPDDRPTVARALAADDGPVDLEYRVLRPDGSTRTVRDRRTRIGNHESSRVAGIVEDVTEARLEEAKTNELRRQLAKSERLQAVGTLAGGIAHDFNNILAAVHVNAEIVRESAPELGTARTAVDGILAASARAKSLVKRMLAFARHDESPVSSVDVGELAREVVGLLRPIVPSAVAIALAVERDVPRVLADATQLHQVLVNLVTNANHAIGNHMGRIELDVSSRWLRQEEVAGLGAGHFVVISVHDDGAGMDEATRTRIFDPFSTTKRQREGTGLGLSVVHGVVTSHRGVIEVESALGKGTTFRFYLPAEEPVAPAPAEPLRRAPIPVLALAREVLVVDDDEMVNESTMLVLTSLGVRGHSVSAPDAAIALVAQDPERFALVITDLTMPGMMGDELASRLRAVAPGLPVVLVSGNEITMPPGLFAAILPKPYSRAAFAEVIARCASGAAAAQ